MAPEADRPDYYRILGVSRLATPDQIKAAFREMARKRHPDFGGTTDEFVALQHAYEILQDPTQRADYDAYLMRQAKAAKGNREMSMFTVGTRAVPDTPEPEPEPTPTAAHGQPRASRQDLDRLLRKGQLHEADAVARQWVTKGIDQGYAHFVLGQIKMKEGHPDEACSRFSLALQFEPRNEEFLRHFESASKSTAPEPGMAKAPGCAGALALLAAFGLSRWLELPLRGV